MHPIHRLILRRGVPPRVQHVHEARGGEIDSHASSLEGDEDHIRRVRVGALKFPDALLPPRRRDAAGQSNALEPGSLDGLLRDVDEGHELAEHHGFGLATAVAAGPEVRLEPGHERLGLGAGGRRARAGRRPVASLPVLVWRRLHELTRLAVRAAERARPLPLERGRDASPAKHVRASGDHGVEHRSEADAAIVEATRAENRQQLSHLLARRRSHRLFFPVLPPGHECAVAAQLSQTKDDLESVSVVAEQGPVFDHASYGFLRGSEQIGVPRPVLQTHLHGLHQHLLGRQAHKRGAVLQLLFLGASERDGGHEGDQAIVSHRVAGVDRLVYHAGPERPVVQWLQAKEREEGVKVVEAILYGCAGDGPPSLRGELPDGDGLTHVGVLDVVSLVEHNPEPLDLVEHGALVGGEGPVGGDDDVVAGQLVCHLGL